MISPKGIPLDPILKGSENNPSKRTEGHLKELVDIEKKNAKKQESPKTKTPPPKKEEKKDKAKDAKKEKLEEDSLTNMYNLFPKIKGFFVNKDKDKKLDQLITSKFAENLKKGVFFNMTKGILKLGAYLTGGGFIDALMGLLAMAFIDPSGGLFAMLINLFSTLVVWLINMLATLIPRIVGLIANMIPVIIQAISKIFDAVIKLIPIIIETLIKLIPVLVQALGSIAGALIEGFLKAVPLLLVAFIKLVPVLVKAIIDLFTTGGEQRKKLFMGIFQEIGKMFPEIWRVIKDALSNLGMFLWDNITSIFSDVQKLWNKFGTPMMNFLYDTFTKGFDKVVNYLFSNSGAFNTAIESTFDKILPMIISGLEMIAPLLEKGLQKLIPMILKVIDMIIPLALKFVDFIAEKGVPLLIQGFKIILSTAFSLIKTLVGAIIPLILKLIPILFKIGWTLLKALFTIVAELTPILFTTLMDVIDVIGDAAGDLLIGILKIIGNAILDFAGWIVSPFVSGAKRVWKAFSSFLDAMVKFPIKLKEALFSIIDNLISKVKSFFGFGGSDKKEEVKPAPRSSGGTIIANLLEPKWLKDFMTDMINQFLSVVKALGIFFGGFSITKGGFTKSWDESMKEGMRATGDWNVAQDMVVKIHKGEMVVPQDTAQLVRAGREDFTTFNEGYKGTPVSTSNTTVNNVSSSNNSTLENLLMELIKVTKEKEMKVEIKSPSGGSVSSSGEGTLNLSRI